MLPDGRRNRTLPQAEEYIEDARRWKASMERYALYLAEKAKDPNHQYRTYVVDHIVQEFKVTIRSLTGVGESQIKQLIEQKFEVVNLETLNVQHISVECIE